MTVLLWASLLLLLLLLSVVAIMAALVPWSVHRTMTIDSTHTQCRGSREDFWKEFGSHQWEAQRPPHRHSYFDQSTKSQIHASIIEFDGIGMLLGPVDYLMVEWRLWRIRPNRIGKSWPQREVAQK